MPDNQPVQPESDDLQFEPFPVDCLPGPLASFVDAVATSIGCDPSFVALPVLSVAGAAVGNTARLRLKAGYDVPPVVWSITIGESGSGKSPAFEAAMRPLVAMQDRSLKAHAAEMDLHKSHMKVYQRELKRWEAKGDSSISPPHEPREPVAKRYYVTDTTIQALVKRLSENPRGLLLGVDEIDGWFGSFDKFSGGSGSDASQYLSMHGAGTITVDRVGNGVMSVPRGALCIVGGVQPKILNSSMTIKHRQSGMSPRILKASPPRRKKQWTDSEVSAEIAAGYAELIETMHLIDFDGTDDDGCPKPHIVELSADAKRLYVAFANRNSDEQSALSGELASTWDKLENYAARFALIFHYVRVASGDSALSDQRQVDAVSMSQAIRLAEWFKGEARRVHAILSPVRGKGDGLSDDEAIEIIRENGGRVTAKKLRDSSRHARGAGVAESLMQRLAEAGHGTVGPTAHGQSMQFVLST